MVYAPWGCGSCGECADGNENICRNATEAGLVVDGGYAERLRVPDVRYLAALDGLDPTAAAPLACGGLTAYRAVDHVLTGLHARGDAGRVAVIGAGGLGQFAIRYLRVLCDAAVIAVDIDPAKRDNAVAVGAHTACDPADEIAPVDAVLDFAGATATLELAARIVRRRGTVVVIGLGGGRIPFGFAAVPHEARFLTSVWGTRSQLDELLALARREPSIVQPVEVLPLSDAQLAHERLRAGQVRGRIVLVPDR
jgi:propanol-preferring alcohol dehydrogenase